MGVYVDYVFFDRIVVDSLWGMTYGEFAKKYPRTRKRIAVIFASEIRLPSWEKPEDLDWVVGDSLLEEVFESYKDQIAELETFLEDKTLSWAISHCIDCYYVMEGLFENIPSIRKQGYAFTGGRLAHDGLGLEPIVAAGVEAFLAQKISWPVLRAILTLHCGDNYSNYDLRLTRKERSLVFGKIPLYPKIYRWQRPEACWGGMCYTGCLGIRDTRLFMRFVIQAWEENWPVSRLKNYDEWPLGKPKHYFRDFYLPKELHKLISRRAKHFKKPCVFLYVA